LRTAKSAFPEDFTLLTSMTSANIETSAEMVLAAARNHNFDEASFIKVVETTSERIDNLPQIIEALSANPSMDLNSALSLSLEFLGNRLTVSLEAIKTALRFSGLAPLLLSSLLTLTNNKNVVANKVLLAAAANRGETAGALFEHLLECAGSDLTVPENVLVAIAENEVYGATLLRLLFERSGPDFDFTERVLTAAVQANVIEFERSILPSLRYLRKVVVSDKILRKAGELVLKKPKPPARILKMQTYGAVTMLRENEPVTQAEITAAAAAGQLHYADMLNVIRQRSGEFRVNVELVKMLVLRFTPRASAYAAFASCPPSIRLEDRWASPNTIGDSYNQQLQLLRKERGAMLDLLLEHLDVNEFEELVLTTRIVEFAAVLGSTSALKTLSNGYTMNKGIFRTALLVAELSIDIQSGAKAEDSKPTLEAIAENAGDATTTFMCNILLMVAIELKRTHMVDGLLERALAEPTFVDLYQRTPLLLASITLVPHIFRSLLGYGAGDLLSHRDFMGRTPRKCINALVRATHNVTLWQELLDGIEGTERFGTTCGPEMVLLRKE